MPRPKSVAPFTRGGDSSPTARTRQHLGILPSSSKVIRSFKGQTAGGGVDPPCSLRAARHAILRARRSPEQAADRPAVGEAETHPDLGQGPHSPPLHDGDPFAVAFDEGILQQSERERRGGDAGGSVLRVA